MLTGPGHGGYNRPYRSSIYPMSYVSCDPPKGGKNETAALKMKPSGIKWNGWSSISHRYLSGNADPGVPERNHSIHPGSIQNILTREQNVLYCLPSFFFHDCFSKSVLVYYIFTIIKKKIEIQNILLETRSWKKSWTKHSILLH